MAKIRVDLTYPIFNGATVIFDAPCDCTGADGLTVNHLGGSQTFTFCDAHGEDLSGIGDVFVAGVPVKVILDVTNSKAFVQNGDNNSHLARVLADMQLSIRLLQSPVESGSYVGTGTKGKYHPNVLTLPFIPKLVYVRCLKSVYTSATGTVTDTYYNDSEGSSFVWVEGLEVITTVNDVNLLFSREDKTLSWYVSTDGDAVDQFNGCSDRATYAYAYVAIG